MTERMAAGVEICGMGCSASAMESATGRAAAGCWSWGGGAGSGGAAGMLEDRSGGMGGVFAICGAWTATRTGATGESAQGVTVNSGAPIRNQMRKAPQSTPRTTAGSTSNPALGGMRLPGRLRATLDPLWSASLRQVGLTPNSDTVSASQAQALGGA